MEQSLALMSAHIHFVVSFRWIWSLPEITWTCKNRHLLTGLPQVNEGAAQSADKVGAV